MNEQLNESQEKEKINQIIQILTGMSVEDARRILRSTINKIQEIVIVSI
jgi:ribosomal protein L22